MLKEVFDQTCLAVGSYLLLLLALAATKAVLDYFRWKPDKTRLIIPRTTSISAGVPVIAPFNAEPEEAMVMIQPVVKVQPMKIQPIQPVKARQIKPTVALAVAVADPVECAKCGKQIKSPPKKTSDGPQFKCEHCGTTVAFA